MNVGRVLQLATSELADASDTARLDAEVLMAHALGVSRSDMLLHQMNAPEPVGFAELITRRARAEPVAYITGEQEFYGREFLVTPEVLIPRSDSETLIELALAMTDERLAEGQKAGAQKAEGYQGEGALVLDCGTGSGALLVTLLAERPAWRGAGIDRSLGALAVAAANAARLGCGARARMVRRDWHEPGWAEGLAGSAKGFDLIIANPPYVESGAELARDVSAYEPAGALYAGADGLRDYRQLIPQLCALLAPGGRAVVEIGAQQGEAVREIAHEAGFFTTLAYDLGGRPRAIGLTDCAERA